jgi:hypothetical protein
VIERATSNRLPFVDTEIELAQLPHDHVGRNPDHMRGHAVGIEVSESDHRDAAIRQGVQVLQSSFQRVRVLDGVHDRYLAHAADSPHIRRGILSATFLYEPAKSIGAS